MPPRVAPSFSRASRRRIPKLGAGTLRVTRVSVAETGTATGPDWWNCPSSMSLLTRRIVGLESGVLETARAATVTVFVPELSIGRHANHERVPGPVRCAITVPTPRLWVNAVVLVGSVALPSPAENDRADAMFKLPIPIAIAIDVARSFLIIRLPPLRWPPIGHWDSCNFEFVS